MKSRESSRGRAEGGFIMTLGGRGGVKVATFRGWEFTGGVFNGRIKSTLLRTWNALDGVHTGG